LAGFENTKLYFTTNYDDVIEKALQPRNPHVLVNRGDGGLWLSDANKPPQQVSFTGSELYTLLNDPARTGTPLRPIVFKLHGSINRTDAKHDSYLITMDDYLKSLDGLPPYISSLLKDQDILVLGYGLLDWNLRIILRLVKINSRARSKVWVIVGHDDPRQK